LSSRHRHRRRWARPPAVSYDWQYHHHHQYHINTRGRHGFDFSASSQKVATQLPESSSGCHLLIVGVGYSPRCGATRAATRFRSVSFLTVTANNETQTKAEVFFSIVIIMVTCSLGVHMIVYSKGMQGRHTSYYSIPLPRPIIAGDKRVFYDKETTTFRVEGIPTPAWLVKCLG
jgi:hypothetical protein